MDNNSLCTKFLAKLPQFSRDIYLNPSMVINALASVRVTLIPSSNTHLNMRYFCAIMFSNISCWLCEHNFESV